MLFTQDTLTPTLSQRARGLIQDTSERKPDVAERTHATP